MQLFLNTQVEFQIVQFHLLSSFYFVSYLQQLVHVDRNSDGVSNDYTELQEEADLYFFMFQVFRNYSCGPYRSSVSWSCFDL